MSKITVTTIAGLTSGGDANTVKIESGDTLAVQTNATVGGTLGVTGATTLTGDLTVDTSTLKVDSSNNRVGIGTTSPSSVVNIQSTKTTALSSEAHFTTLGLCIDDDTAFNTALAGGGIAFRHKRNSSGVMNTYAAIDGVRIDNASDRYGGFLRFFTNNDSTGVPLERARIDSSGNLFVGKTSSSSATDGFEYNNGGQLAVTRNNDTVILANRRSNHGNIIDFRIDNNLIGSIGSESGKLRVNSNSGSNLLLATDGTTRVAIDSVRLYPNTDNNYDLGLSSNRFDDIFATNSTIQTSDQNEKQDIANATTKELNVAKKLSALFKTFRWKDKVTEKGDKARTHSGIIAQDIQSAFSAEGLDASNYGLFTSDTWWEKEIKVDAVEADEEKGIEAKDAYTYMDIKNEKTDGYTERTRLGVRYPELFSFIFSSIESRLTALESK